MLFPEQSLAMTAPVVTGGVEDGGHKLAMTAPVVTGLSYMQVTFIFFLLMKRNLYVYN